MLGICRSKISNTKALGQKTKIVILFQNIHLSSRYLILDTFPNGQTWCDHLNLKPFRSHITRIKMSKLRQNNIH